METTRRNSGRSRIRTARLVAVIGFGAVIASGVPVVPGVSGLAASARTAHRARAVDHVVKVAFTAEAGPPISFTPTCDAAKACLVPVSGGAPSTVTGDLQGEGVYAGAARVLGSNEAVSSAMSTFVGTVKGCGAGSFTSRYVAHYAASLPRGGGGTWTIVPALGTGALAGATGHGTFVVGTINADLSGTDVYSGVIRC